jgi:hypothetical protein
MQQRIYHQLFRGLAPRASVISASIFLCSLSIGLLGARELLKLQTSFTQDVVRKPPSPLWNRELKLAQKAFPSQGEEIREPWGLEEIRWYVGSFFKRLGPVEKKDLVRAIHDECRFYGLAPQLVLSVIAAESEGAHDLVSPKGAMGLMQLHPTTAQSMAEEVNVPWGGEDSLYHPVINVRLGIRYLFNMIQRYQDLPLALSAYYMGPNKLDRLLMRDQELPWHYVDRVLDLYRTL